MSYVILIIVSNAGTMGKNQNWQRRVESAEARRQEARARKARKNDREAYRRQASDLLSHLASSAATSTGEDVVVHVAGDTSKILDVHVWVDKPPPATSSAPAKHSAGNETDESVGHKSKRNSPRKPLTEAGETDQPQLLLCSDHFFFDRCAVASSGGKGNKGRSTKSKASCKFHHTKDPTIASVLKVTANVEASADACRQACASEEPGAADMLWYLHTSTCTTESLGDALQSCLSDSGVGSASLVYVVVETVFLYDRYRGGVLRVCDESEVAEPIFIPGNRERRNRQRSRGESMGSIAEEPKMMAMRHRARSRGESMGSIVDASSASRKLSFQRSRSESIAEQSTGRGEDDKGEGCLLLDVPSSVLERIILFLPDLYTGNLPLVCKAWNGDIGRNSPHLWRQLLKRRGWPVPLEAGVEANLATTTKDTIIFRNAFTDHYEVSRDMRSIGKLFRGRRVERSGGTKVVYDMPDTPCTEAAIIPYHSFPGTPRSESGRTSAVRVLGAGRVIIANEWDCTVRIFEATSTKGSLKCRQIVSAKISPEPNSYRRFWCLSHMTIDEERIYCICEPFGRYADGSRSTHLMVVEKESLLCSVEGGTDHRPSALHPNDVDSFNLLELVGNFILKSKLYPFDNAEEELFDIIKEGQNEKLDLVINDVLSCGKRRLLVKACFLLDGNRLLDDPTTTNRLFLFSLEDRRIIWSSTFGVDKCRLSGQQMPTALALFRLAVMPRRGYDPGIVEIGTDNSILANKRLIGQDIPSGGAIGRAVEKVIETWKQNCDGIITKASREIASPIIICSTMRTAIAHPFQISHGQGDRHPCFRTVLSFSVKTSQNADDDVQCIIIDDYELVLSMSFWRSDYVVLLCRELEEVEHNPSSSFDFFLSSIYYSIVHIPTRAEIDRQYLRVGTPDFGLESTPSLTIDETSGMIALEIAGECLIMGGRGVRDLVTKDHYISEDGDQKSPAKKKKPKKRMAKKDGFARGMARYVN